MTKNKKYSVAAVVAIFLVAVAGTSFMKEKETDVQETEAVVEDVENSVTATAMFTEGVSKEKYTSDEILIPEVYGGYAAYQQELDAKYLDVVANNTFTPEEPYIIVNPYEIAPQSALIIFETEEAVSITTSIQGKTSKATIIHTNSEKETYHEIPLIGLYEGLNTVDMMLSNGKSYTYEIITQDIPVGYLNADTIDVLASDASQLSDGLYVLKNTGRTLLDVNGDVRGYFTVEMATSGCDEVTQDGHLFVSIDEYTNYSAILEVDYMGQVYREIYMNDLNTHHDGYLIDDSTLLLGTSYIDLDAYEVVYYDPAFEEIFNYVGGSVEVRSYGEMDALHLNTIDYGGDGYILVSLRNQHAVAKLSYPELEVQWVLSVYENTYMGKEDVYLTPVGENFEWFYSQHDVSLVSENGDGTMDITIFDNGVHRGMDVNAEYPDEELYSRMVHYRVDEVNMTVEQIWDYGEELGNQYLAFVHSSTQYIPESNTYLGNFDAHDAIETGGSEVPREACYIIELTEEKEVVLEFALGAACYRTEKLLADQLYSAWEGIGVSQKEYIYMCEEVASNNTKTVLQEEPVVFQITELAVNQDYMDIAGWMSIESNMGGAITEKKLHLEHVDTGDTYTYDLSNSPWILRDTSVSEEIRSLLDRSAGFKQRRMNISGLEDGVYTMALEMKMDEKSYKGELEQVLCIGE